MLEMYIFGLIVVVTTGLVVKDYKDEIIEKINKFANED